MSVKAESRIRSVAGAMAFATAVALTLVMAVVTALVLTLGAVALLSGPALAAPEGSQPQVVKLSADAQHFLAAVRANFDQWDLDHDGVLTREEIEIDMQNPRIVGGDAAALAALKLGSTTYNQLSETRAFNRADIDAMERDLTAGRKLDRNFVFFYQAGLKKIAEQPRDLFVDGAPRINAIRQDFTTDCYFLSAVGALATVDPQALVRLIARNGDGSFTVSFPRQPAVRVPAPTDSEIATYTISKDGIYLSVLEKAYAILRIRYEPKQASTREPLDSVGFRLGNTIVMELLTGRHTRVIAFPSRTHQALDPSLVPETSQEIRDALRDHRPITLTNAHHVYAVVAYDEQNDLVTIHNPYNRGGLESWIGGGEVVHRTDDGFFTIPTARLVDNFHDVRFEEASRIGSSGRDGAPTVQRVPPPSAARSPVMNAGA